MAENPEFGYGSSVIKYTFPCGGIVYLRVTDQIKNRYENDPAFKEGLNNRAYLHFLEMEEKRKANEVQEIPVVEEEIIANDVDVDEDSSGNDSAGPPLGAARRIYVDGAYIRHAPKSKATKRKRAVKKNPLPSVKKRATATSFNAVGSSCNATASSSNAAKSSSNADASSSNATESSSNAAASLSNVAESSSNIVASSSNGAPSSFNDTPDFVNPDGNSDTDSGQENEECNNQDLPRDDLDPDVGGDTDKWTVNEITVFLDVYKSYKEEFDQPYAVKFRIWNKIAKLPRIAALHKSTTQLSRKLNNLKKTWRKIKRPTPQGSASRKIPWRWTSVMDDIFGDDPAINLEHVAEVGDKASKKDQPKASNWKAQLLEIEMERVDVLKDIARSQVRKTDTFDRLTSVIEKWVNK